LALDEQDVEVPKLERSPTAATAATADTAASAPVEVVVVEVSAPTAILIDLTAPEVDEADAKARRDEADCETDPTPCKKPKAADA
jgi:hypothetical protein